MLSKTRCPIGSKKAVFNLLIKGAPAPEKCYARVWPGHRVLPLNFGIFKTKYFLKSIVSLTLPPCVPAKL